MIDKTCIFKLELTSSDSQFEPIGISIVTHIKTTER